MRVQLPQSRDLTLFLQPMRDAGNGLPIVPVDYRVSVGTGGVAVVSAWVPAGCVGAVRHYVADTLEVSVITPGAAPATPRIVAANAALGRPTVVFEPGGHVGSYTVGIAATAMPNLLTSRPDTHSYVRVDPSPKQLFRIPAFATHMQLRVRANTGVADADMQVFGVTPNGGITVSGTPVGDWILTPQPLPPDIVLISIVNADAGAAHFDIFPVFTCEL